MTKKRGYWLKGAVITAVGLLLVGCSHSSPDSKESLRNDSKPVTGITMQMEETPGAWLDGRNLNENDKKKVNDFQVTTVSGECYFYSESTLGKSKETKDKKKSETNTGREATSEQYSSMKPTDTKNELSYIIDSNEGQLTFKGTPTKNALSLNTTLSDDSTIRLSYGCTDGVLKNKDELISQFDVMVELVKIDIERAEK